MTMHKGFGDWYRAASVNPPAELLELRWKGVDQATSGLNAERVIELVRLFAIRPKSGFAGPEFLDASFRDHDTAFPRHGNLEELRALAGAVLRNAIETRQTAASACAYGITCATFGPRAQSLAATEHVAAAEEFLVSRARAVRDSSTVTNAKPTALSKERVGELLTQALFAPIPNVREPLLTALSEQSTANAVIEQKVAVLTAMVQSQREESDLLWWIQSSSSRDLKTPFADMTAASAACVFPFELADSTVFIPGPSAILGLLLAGLSKTTGKVETSIHGAVTATPREWREGRMKQSPVSAAAAGPLCPIYFAIGTSLQTDGEVDWHPIYRKHCELLLEDAYNASEIAQQLYRELMFVRALTELPK